LFTFATTVFVLIYPKCQIEIRFVFVAISLAFAFCCRAEADYMNLTGGSTAEMRLADIIVANANLVNIFQDIRRFISATVVKNSLGEGKEKARTSRPAKKLSANGPR
jgi:hypothetical protein